MIEPGLMMQRRPVGVVALAPAIRQRYSEGDRLLWAGALVASERPAAVASRVGADFSRVPIHTRARPTAGRAPNAELLLRQKADKPAKSSDIVACKEDQQTKLRDGIAAGQRLASNAAAALERLVPPLGTDTALTANFGPDADRASIRSRFADIGTVLDGLDADKVTCKKTCKDKKGADFCAEGTVGGPGIFLCSAFTGAGCPAGPVMLHEAAHNTGAGGDFDRRGGKYSPKNPEENAYSYEYFALDLDAAIRKSEGILPPRRKHDVTPP